MRPFLDFSFNPDIGSLVLPIPVLYVLISSHSSPGSCGFSGGHVKLRSTVATSHKITTVVRAGGFSWRQPHSNDGDSPSNHNSQKDGSSSANIEREAPSSRDLSSPSSSSSTLSSSSSIAEKASVSLGGVIENIAHSANGKQSISSFPLSSSGSQAQNHTLSGSNVGLLSADSSSPSFKQLSRMSKGIKTAFGVFEGFKLIQKLHSPSAEDALLLGPGGNWVFLSVKVTKFFAKGLKMTQKVLTSSPVSKLIFQGRRSNAVVERLVYGDLASVVKGFNAVYSAIRVAQFTKSFGKLPMPQEELRLRSVNFIWKGYTFSKSIMNILDVIAGKNGWALAYMGKGFFIMKKAIEGFGVMAKAIFLSKELGLVVLKRAAISGGTFAVVFSTYSRSQKGESPTWVSLESRWKQPTGMTLTCEDRLFNPGLPLCQSIGGKDGKLSLVCTLFKCSLEELESVNTNAFEEHDPQMILCLALPIGNGEIPVSAC